MSDYDPIKENKKKVLSLEEQSQILSCLKLKLSFLSSKKPDQIKLFQSLKELIENLSASVSCQEWNENLKYKARLKAEAESIIDSSLSSEDNLRLRWLLKSVRLETHD